jgi:RNA 2',3'-cyclic 3'-phosphodiesterase
MVGKLTRAFIALEFNDDVIREVARVQELLRGQNFTGKMTELENLHLTLKFLGEINLDMLEKVKLKLKEVKFKEFEARLGEIGTFSLRGNPKIVWIKLVGEAIWTLQKKIDENLKDLFKSEDRFMSHVTIARVKYVKNKKDFTKYVKNIGIQSINFNVRKFKLVKSELDKIGPKYELIEEYNFE